LSICTRKTSFRET